MNGEQRRRAQDTLRVVDALVRPSEGDGSALVSGAGCLCSRGRDQIEPVVWPGSLSCDLRSLPQRVGSRHVTRLACV